MMIGSASSRSPADTIAVRSTAAAAELQAAALVGRGDRRLHPRSRRQWLVEGPFLALEIAAERLLDRLAPRRSEQVRRPRSRPGRRVADLLRHGLVQVHRVRRHAVTAPVRRRPCRPLPIDLVRGSRPDQRDVVDRAGLHADLAVPGKVEVGRDEVGQSSGPSPKGALPPVLTSVSVNSFSRAATAGRGRVAREHLR